MYKGLTQYSTDYNPNLNAAAMQSQGMDCYFKIADNIRITIEINYNLSKSCTQTAAVTIQSPNPNTALK
jgi:hypothetical protein